MTNCKNSMTDDDVLLKGMAFCQKHRKKSGRCKNNCPLIGNICIRANGDIAFPVKELGNDDDSMPFMNFTEQFRIMLSTIMRDNN